MDEVFATKRQRITSLLEASEMPPTRGCTVWSSAP